MAKRLVRTGDDKYDENWNMSADIGGLKGRRQCGQVVSALDLQSEDPGFNTRPNRWLDLFKSSHKVVNIQLVCLYPVGIVSLVTFHYQPIPNCPKPLL